ncbi:DNA (cytosine-5-)-methyltransferase [Vibrio cholerae]|uniref:DNA (cytosine-5-)-methyltransferase n=1 Tax=Vibrio cholerae TaxID=666 RepID=A0A395U2H2_VIBCL|nr:DNA cytosine methyltransferase [Vibrio cholerae]RGP89855.1 DNA (cytosine-5-)-methyltransferase [Vibrio cholerae]RGP90039.1 DNA (cytosine-5-)-methyltransferase [Vibrio cholerae]RGP90762.1 DNA (cytosine-5-)-methyltransferase [Vibrio cholerae]HAS2628671.1 DNA cytosine methyltransferase [Vibrio cholerae]HAS3550341.1 DNA cytosine methyltransferase [Vibrio cholerae]
MKGIDLFAGAGGTTKGAKESGVDILWAANHNPIAVAYHKLNHPEVHHLVQDLQQADWSLVPDHDIVFASPCCQGHSRAAGKKKQTKKADLSRSTAWAVVSCLEAHRSPVSIIENVPDFLEWELYKPWESAMRTLGYSLSINIVNACDLGIPQNRERLFIVATRSANPIKLKLETEPHVAARTIIDLNESGYEWDLVTNRVEATQLRVKNGRKQFGDIFLDAAYGSAKSGRSIDKPLGAVTTVNKHSLIIGDKIRPLSIRELAAAQTFSDDYIWPDKSVTTKMMIGNAVPPKMAKKITSAVLKAL